MSETTNPVSFEEQYRIFKQIESRILDRLARLDQEELLVGLRVAYDFLDSANDPAMLPHAVQFGYLEPVDRSLQCDSIDEANAEELWLQTTDSGLSVHPLPRDFLEELYDQAKSELEQQAGAPLRIGIFAVLYGSPIKAYSISCTCANRKKKYTLYNRRNKVSNSYCSTKPC